MNPAERMKHLARLAADDRTPEGERRNAAIALAKMVVAEGAPSATDPVFDALKKQYAKLVVDFDVQSMTLAGSRRVAEAAVKERKELESKLEALRQSQRSEAANLERQLRQSGEEVNRLKRELKEAKNGNDWRAELDAMTRRATQAEALVKSLRGQRGAPEESSAMVPHETPAPKDRPEPSSGLVDGSGKIIRVDGLSDIPDNIPYGSKVMLNLQRTHEGFQLLCSTLSLNDERRATSWPFYSPFKIGAI